MKYCATKFGQWAIVLAIAVGALGFQAAQAQTGLDALGDFADPSATPEPDDVVKASASFTAPNAERKATLSITAEVIPGWHIYSLTQKAGGPLASKIKLAPSNDFKLLGDFTPSQAPEKHTYQEVWPDLVVEEHEGTITWSAPIEFAAGVDPSKIEIGGSLYAQACSTGNTCLFPTDFKFTARLTKAEGDKPVGGTSAAANQAAPAPPAKPNGTETYQHDLSHVTLQGSLEPAVATPGSIARLKIVANPDAGYHIYAYAEKDPVDVSKPTLIVLTDTSGFRFTTPKPDAPPTEKATKLTKSGKESYHEKPVTWTVELEIPKDAKPGNYPIKGIVGFQTCKDTGCDAPRGAWFEGMLTVGESGAAGNTKIYFRDGKYAEAAKLAKGESLTESAAAVAPPTQNALPPASTGGFDESAIAHNVKFETTALKIALSAFFGGMILNLMPCVFPVIGLKILSFVEQSHHDRFRLLALNLWYTLGVILVFLAIAAVAIVLRVFLDLNFIYGAQNSIPGYAVGMAAIMFVMGLSLLGVWEIPIPGFVGSGKASHAMAQEGAFGAMAKGAITTLLGASCGGPIVAVAFGFALDRNSSALATLAVFGLIGLGMASPYLIIGANPKLVRFLPKPGAWMDTFKHLCGFVLLAAMVWVLSWLPLDFVMPTVAFLVSLWFGCWLVGRVPLTESAGKRLRAWGFATIVSIAGGFLAFGWLAPSANEKLESHVAAEVARQVQALKIAKSTHEENPESPRLPWQPFSKELLRQLTAEGKTVMVDFTADWCVNCKTLEGLVLNTQAVKGVVVKNGVVPLVADYTTFSAEITDMLALLKASALPVLAIFPAENPNNPEIFRDGYTQQMLINALEKAGPSKPRTSSETAMR